MAQTKAQLLGPVVGDVVMDVSTLSLDAEGNKVGIGHSEPDLTLHVSGVNGLPSSSGSTPTGHLTIRNKAGSTHGMFMGVSDASPWSSWIQAQDAINNATNYPLLLNPNGGNVGIGTVNPSAKLQVLGGSGDQLWLDNAGERYTQISLRNNGTQKAALWLDETNDEFDLFAASGYGIRLLAGGQERLRIDADGDLEYRYNDADTSTEVGATQVPHGFRILNQNNTLGRLAGITFAHGGGESANAGIFHETTNTANTSTAGLGDLTFWTKPTGVSHMVERLRIDSAGRMTANGVSVNNAWGGGDDLVLGGTGSGTRTGITLVSGSDTDGGIYWSHGTGNNRFAGQIAYNHASDMMSFYTNSTAQLRITSGGDVGIGDSAPDSNYGTNLSVHSTATDGARLKLSDGTTGKDNLSGLDIISTGGNAYIINRENSDMLFTTGVGAFSFTTNGFERFLIDSDGRTTAGDGNSTSGTTILQGNYNGLNKLNVIGSHYSDGGTTICYAVRPKTGSVGFVSSAGNGALKKAALEINGEFIFRSASSSTVAIDSTVTLTQKMKIDLSGKVGIGFDAESATLEVQGQNAYASSANSLATSTSKAALRVKGSNNSSDSLWVGVETSSAQPYLQGANGTGSNSKNLLLNPFGANVGIGTTSPGAKFVVSGLSMSNAAGGVELEGSWPWLKFKDTETNQASWIQYVDGGRFYIKEIDYADRNSTPSTVGTERLQINGSGKVGIGVDPDVRLHVRTSANEVGKFETTSTADMAIELKNSQGSIFFGLGGGEEFAVGTSWDLNGNDNLFAIKQDGKVGINTVSPVSRLHISDDISYGKTSYASASQGNSQTRPPGTFQWDNTTPAGGSGRGYRGWVQSGDAYPNASSYFDLLVRNSGFYRVTVKRSHSSANASVATMLIYGLANSTGSNKPVVHISGITGSGSGTGTAQSGHGYGSGNTVANFYWDIVSYNINTHDCIIRIRTNTSNNQGIIALVEEI